MAWTHAESAAFVRKGVYNYGIKALSANRFRMCCVCCSFFYACHNSKLRERGRGIPLPHGEGLGLASSFVAQIGGKENYVYAKWKERKKAWPKAARLRLTSPHLTSSRFLWRTPARIVCDFAQWSEKAVNLSSLSPFLHPTLSLPSD